MNVLVVSQYFWPENFRVNDLVAGLVLRGHEVTVLTGLPNYPSGRFFEGYGPRGPWRETYAGANVVRVPLIPRMDGGGVRLAANYLSFALTGSLGALGRLRGRFDAIFVFGGTPITVGIPAAVASRRFHAPILFWVLDLWPESLTAAGAVRSPAVLEATGHLADWTYAQSARVLVASRAFIPAIVQRGVPQERISYFPNWVEPEYVTSDPPSSVEMPPLPDGFRVMYAGNIGAAQDFPAVLGAAERLRAHPEVHWIIVGDGRMAAWAKGEVQRGGLANQVHFLGQHPPDKMPAFFAAADALLVSLKRDPTFTLTVPGKLQSYLGAGRPVLAMLDGEGARLVDEAGAGFTCPAGDSEMLAANVLRVLALTPDERSRLGNNGCRYADEHFSRDGMFDRLESLLAKVVLEGG